MFRLSYFFWKCKTMDTTLMKSWFTYWWDFWVFSLYFFPNWLANSIAGVKFSISYYFVGSVGCFWSPVSSFFIILRFFWFLGFLSSLSSLLFLASFVWAPPLLNFSWSVVFCSWDVVSTVSFLSLVLFGYLIFGSTSFLSFWDKFCVSGFYFSC